MAADLGELKPTQRPRLMDLVRDAGVDVSSWGDFAGGAKRAASNPKYCYEWSFHQPGRVVVLSVWHRTLRLTAGRIILTDNLRDTAEFYASKPGKGMWARRAVAFDHCVAAAARDGLAVRAIICDGTMRPKYDVKAKAAKVRARLLDPVPWAVQSYDAKTGAFTLRRGALPGRLKDQFDGEEPINSPTETRTASGTVFVRNPAVRRYALARAKGRCEWCGEPGFAMDDGSMFLETHHVVPLSENGPDKRTNVVALCATHHREAHLGSSRRKMREQLSRFLKTGKMVAGAV